MTASRSHLSSPKTLFCALCRRNAPAGGHPRVTETADRAPEEHLATCPKCGSMHEPHCEGARSPKQPAVARKPSMWPGGAIFAPTDDPEIAPYRLWLWRERPGGDPRNRVAFIGLNPSKADVEFDDATIRKCIGFAERWGFDCLDMLNLWALRSREPDALLTAKAPEFGMFKPVSFKPSITDGDRIVREALRRVRRVVAAWGSHEMVKRHPERVREVLALVPAGVEVVALRVSDKTGMPWHPLYVPYDEKPLPFSLGGTP